MKSLIRRKLTVNEKRNLMYEIEDQLSENVKRMSGDVAAAVLFSLRQEYGFGKKRLLRFYESFRTIMKELADHYEMHDDTEYLCRIKLREIGVEVDYDMMDFGYKYKKN